MNSTSDLPLGTRITLRRTQTVNNEVKENLKTLRLHMAGKIRAQKLYYDRPGQSPLLRSSKMGNKPSVHDRLGIHKKKTMAFDFSTSDTIIRNKQFRKKRNNNGIVKFKNRNNNYTKNLGQLRLQKIRQQFASEKLPVFSRIRLRRNMPSTHPFNCTVEVKNPSIYNGNESCINHSVRGSLDSILQEEIRILQSQNVVEPNVIPNQPIFTIGYGVTNITINNRFSVLP